MTRTAVWRDGLAALACLLAAVLGGDLLTARMSTHMLVQLPLLVLAGAWGQQAWHAWRSAPGPALARDRATASRGALPSAQRDGARRRWSYNEFGVPGLLFASLIGACWMLPKALDDALVDWRVAAFKFVGLPLAGWILRASLRRSNTVITVFFLGNFCWMSAIVGLVYRDQPVRLCNAYLQDDQIWAGNGLIALSIGLPLLWLLSHARPIWRYLNR